MTRAVQRFFAQLALGYALLMGLYFLVPDGWLLAAYHHAIVAPGAALVRLLAPGALVNAELNVLRSPGVVLEIVRGCDGTGVLFMLYAAVLAYPATWRRRGAALGGATAFVYVLNLARVVALYFIAARRPAWFEAAHTLYVPGLFVVAALAFFDVWARRRGTPDVLA
ncbi:MAG: exosortase family protein XrtM [Gammaproteobacteria bacterium]|nr:exosortase family protein XrtM [Gammaproteobacteria bacterium]